jgi:uncharacterized membrane protein YqaE (UPF0057 family)
MVWMLIGLCLYFLPTVIGWNKKNVGAIFVLNLLLGWTAIGWIVAMVWACTVEQEQPTYNQQSSSQSRPFNRFEELGKLEHLYSSGAISKQYYDSEKARLMKAN